jgi:hypothetical protein
MSYNLGEIKFEIINNCKDYFNSSKYPKDSDYDSEFDFDKGIDLFFKTVIHRCGVSDLDGLTKTIIPTLHEAYFSKRGELTPLKTLSNELEAYLKKIAYIISSGSDNFSNDKSKSLISLYNHLSLSSTTLKASDLCEENLSSFKGANEFIEFLCRAYITRNAVHKSPNWKLLEIVFNLESTLVVYLYATFKYYKRLLPIVGSIELPSKPTRAIVSVEKSNKQALYDFISYNNGTSQIRTQIVHSFILHTLSNNGSEMSISEIQRISNTHFNTEADISFYKNIVKELAKPDFNKIVISGVLNDKISLSDSERARINKLKDDLYYQEEMFSVEISGILKNYNIENKKDDVIKAITRLFELNYNIDVREILNDGINAKDNVQNLKELSDYLKQIVPKGKNPETLLKELIVKSSENDFINKITAGQVFARVSNLPEIQEYLNQQVRVIYLDTNVLLYVMCYYYEDDPEYSNVYYQTIRELLKYQDTHSNIYLKTTSCYVSEVSYHLKEALQLIPFDEMGLFSKIGNSNNVFYKFYIFLKSNHNLDKGVNCFGDFMRGFEHTEEDLDNAKFFKYSYGLVVDVLNHMGIEVVDLNHYVNEEVQEVVKNALTLNGKFKDSVPLANDTKMICHLADKNLHDVEPTFITWDNSFFDIRRKVSNRFKNHRMWHLFTPNKLLNHSKLLEFKIDSSNVTNEFLNIIDGVNLPEKTRDILDTVSQLLDIEKEERRRYLSKFKEFASKYIFNVEETIQGEVEDIKVNLKPIEKVITELFKYYNDKKRRHNFKDLKNLFLDKVYFDEIVSLLQTGLESYVKDSLVPDVLFIGFDNLIERSKSSKV